MPAQVPIVSAEALAAATRYKEALERRPPVPMMKVTQPSSAGGVTTIEVDHDDRHLGTILQLNAMGIADPELFDGVMKQLANVGCHGQTVTAGGVNFMLSTVYALGPRDAVEALLASQMAAIHCAVMTAARRLAHVENLAQQDSASAMVNKLARTFAGQVETLKKYRATGEQKIHVRHVTVHDGGQAIVGHVGPGVGGGK